MANSVDFLCKTGRKSLLKKCLKNSGKKLNFQKVVEKVSFKQSFAKVFSNVFNKPFTSYKWRVIHTFHIAYNNYY